MLLHQEHIFKALYDIALCGLSIGLPHIVTHEGSIKALHLRLIITQHQIYQSEARRIISHSNRCLSCLGTTARK